MNERELFEALIEKHPTWIEKIKLKGRIDERVKTIEESIEQIKCFNPNTTEEAKGLQEAINIMSRLKGDKELCK